MSSLKMLSKSASDRSTGKGVDKEKDGNTPVEGLGQGEREVLAKAVAAQRTQECKSN